MRERTVEILERCAHAEQLGIVPELPGLCAACHMPSTQPHAGRFLCAACSAPHVIQTYCANCGTRETCATPTAALDAFHDAHLGAVIGTEYCAYCDPEHAPGAVRVIQPAETLPQRTNATA
ncbi:hypothetical protein HY632_01690 [Candidatus Uhrbacteria bacterium]|nr:hypothetical protein [Candidatus Uhrbacteria bacterium]